MAWFHRLATGLDHDRFQDFAEFRDGLGRACPRAMWVSAWLPQGFGSGKGMDEGSS